MNQSKGDSGIRSVQIAGFKKGQSNWHKQRSLMVDNGANKSITISYGLAQLES